MTIPLSSGSSQNWACALALLVLTGTALAFATQAHGRIAAPALAGSVTSPAAPLLPPAPSRQRGRLGHWQSRSPHPRPARQLPPPDQRPTPGRLPVPSLLAARWALLRHPRPS